MSYCKGKRNWRPRLAAWLAVVSAMALAGTAPLAAQTTLRQAAAARHGLKGTPSFPPVISEMRGDERLRPFAPERRAGRTSRAAAPGRDVGQVCAKGGHFR
jgi:hypothetical protein